jgi:murein DD-endopeptidase MepM/ murein hydrolase activator NlpD
VEYNLDQLIREAKFQEHSFKNIITSIKNKQHVWDHTPSIRPLADGNGLKVSGFGFRRDPFTRKLRMHEGIDFAERRGTPILATADGEVVSTGRRSGYGLAVEIDHGYGYSTLYAHCSVIKVKEGDNIKRGDVIALVGSTGRSKGPHVHYEVRVANRPVDPERYLLPEVVTD